MVKKEKQLTFILENNIKNKAVLITKPKDLTSDCLFPHSFCCYLLFLLSKKSDNNIVSDYKFLGSLFHFDVFYAQKDTRQ